MNQSEVIKGYLRDELALFEKYLCASLRSDNERLSEMIAYVFSTNGKRLRPMLVLLTARACGGIVPETYHGAVAVELLHTATLIHDDLIDKSDIRRGKSALHVVYDDTCAVLVGDYLLSSSLSEIVKTNNLEIIRIFSEQGKALAEGEIDQFTLAKEAIIDEEAYFRMIDKKNRKNSRG